VNVLLRYLPKRLVKHAMILSRKCGCYRCQICKLLTEVPLNLTNQHCCDVAYNSPLTYAFSTIPHDNCAMCISLVSCLWPAGHCNWILRTFLVFLFPMCNKCSFRLWRFIFDISVKALTTEGTRSGILSPWGSNHLHGSCSRFQDCYNNDAGRT
jgi:hypothetical protein